jgi:hypothetical protein
MGMRNPFVPFGHHPYLFTKLPHAARLFFAFLNFNSLYVEQLCRWLQKARYAAEH